MSVKLECAGLRVDLHFDPPLTPKQAMALNLRIGSGPWGVEEILFTKSGAMCSVQFQTKMGWGAVRGILQTMTWSVLAEQEAEND
jgi:hypothetical protein